MDETIDVDRYPQLAFLAWSRAVRTVTPAEALSLYEHGRAHVDVHAMDAVERAFFDRLVREVGHGVFLG